MVPIVINAIAISVLSVVVAKVHKECVLEPPENGSNDIYCDVIPYEIDLSRIGDITELDASGNDLNGIYLFSDRNVTLSTVDLSRNGIQNPCHVVTGAAVSVHSLILSANKIRRFSACTVLKNLTVSRNHIKSLTRADMSNATSLEALDLSDNIILWIENDTFAGMPNLQWLDLRGNVLARISEKTLPSAALRYLDVSENYDLDRWTAFDPFENLVELNIAYDARLATSVLGSGQRLQALNASHANLTRVPVAPAPLLGTLVLNGNAIAAVNGGDLDGFPLLHTLHMSGNRVGAVEDDAFGRLDLLTALDLSGNRLDVVPRSLPRSLRTLDLADNRIGNLSADDFAGCERLTALNVRNNRILSVRDSALAPLRSLDVLDLSENPIAMITREMVAGPARLRVLVLEGLAAPDTPAFPFTDTRYLNRIRLARSRHLAAILLNDTAVLASMTHLEYLDLTGCAVTSLPDRLPYHLPKLRALTATELDCDAAGSSSWLADWLCDVRRASDDYDVAAAADGPPGGRTAQALRLRNFGLAGRARSPSVDVRCFGVDGRARPVLDERRCAAIASTTTATAAAVATERAAVFARLSGAAEAAAGEKDPRAPAQRTAARPGLLAFVCVASLLALLACGTALMGFALRRLPGRWRRDAADVDYQSIEIKSLESLNHVERW